MIPKIIIMGGTGFLGKTILRKLQNNDLNNGHLYRTVQVQNKLQIISVNRDLNTKFDLDEFFQEKNSTFQIINCASSRYAKNNEDSRIANYANPLLILNSALQNSHQKIKWIQPESFWQYISEVVPDLDYVNWKNAFSSELVSECANGNLSCTRVVLPHLIGVGDSLNRFLTKLFLELLTFEQSIIKNGDETFAIADVSDVSRYLVQLLHEDSDSVKDNLIIFPYIEITLRKIVEYYLKDFESKPKIIWVNTPHAANPKLDFIQSFKCVSPYFPTSPIQNTLKNIRSWLQEIANSAVT